MKKIILFVFFSAFLFSCHLSLAESYPTTCPVEAQGVLGAVGGCSAIDCNIYSNICEKCCGQSPSSVCTSFSYSDWSTCQSSKQYRNVITSNPSGCTGGTPVTSQVCNTAAFTSLISVFTSSKTEIESGGTINLIFSGSNISKYKLYFSCPKFSTGLNAGLLAASAKIDGVEYCNQEFTVPTGAYTQNLVISSKYSKPLKITIRLRAYDFQEQYVDYKDVILTVANQSSSTINTAAVLATTLTSIISTATSIQEQINFLLNQIKILQQQLFTQQSSSVPITSSAAPTTSVASTTTRESITETTLFNELKTFSYTWNKDLYYGMKNNNDVKALQRALTREGVYSNEITGNFFGLTKQAVIDFQKKHHFSNIPGTGYVGSYTRKALNDTYSK